MGDVDGLNAELQHELERMRQRIADLEASHGADQERTAQDTAQHNDLRFRLFYEQAPLPYQSLDEGGHLLDVNPAWLALFLYRRDQVIAQVWRAAYPASRGTCQDLSRFKSRLVHGVEFDVPAATASPHRIVRGAHRYDEEGHFSRPTAFCVT
jgi:PAS domain-containing protein